LLKYFEVLYIPVISSSSHTNTLELPSEMFIGVLERLLYAGVDGILDNSSDSTFWDASASMGMDFHFLEASTFSTNSGVLQDLVRFFFIFKT